MKSYKEVLENLGVTGFCDASSACNILEKWNKASAFLKISDSFPLMTSPLESDESIYGYVYSPQDIFNFYNSKLVGLNFMPIACSISGSILLVDFSEGNDGECRWLSRRFNVNKNLPLEACLSPIAGAPAQVISALAFDESYQLDDCFDHLRIFRIDLGLE